MRVTTTTTVFPLDSCRKSVMVNFRLVIAHFTPKSKGATLHRYLPKMTATAWLYEYISNAVYCSSLKAPVNTNVRYIFENSIGGKWSWLNKLNSSWPINRQLRLSVSIYNLFPYFIQYAPNCLEHRKCIKIDLKCPTIVLNCLHILDHIFMVDLKSKNLHMGTHKGQNSYFFKMP